MISLVQLKWRAWSLLAMIIVSEAGQYAEVHIDKHQPRPYDFGYKIADESGNTQFRQETSNGKGSVIGSYGYTDIYGLYRKVVYVADKWGFRANVQSNEPGTDNQNPADVQMNVSRPPLLLYAKPTHKRSSNAIIYKDK